MEHGELVRAARKAADTLFTDQTVTQRETKDDLMDLVDYIENMIDTLEG